ncbi:MAG: GNAT family N-acetyltransferase [Microbacteriaceae bacterium]|nr:GNAT family N-acetyltransferase [Microbacteriaceae bacterium]
MPAADLPAFVAPASGSLKAASHSSNHPQRHPSSLRPAVESDAAALHSLAADTFPLACPPGTRALEIERHIAAELSAERFAQFLADPARELFVAHRDGELVGYTMLVYGEPTDAEVAGCLTVRPTVELSKCYFALSQHGTGASAALIALTVAAARARGSAGMWLGVNEHNHRANRFYARHGFEAIGHKYFYVGTELNDDFVRELVL